MKKNNHRIFFGKRTFIQNALLLLSIFLALFCSNLFAQSNKALPVRVAVAGISHGHSSWLLSRKKNDDILVVGIYEPNTEMAERYAKKYGFSKDLLYTDLGKMLDAVKPEAVLAFGSIYAHLAAVKACAPRGIHVMVEKPLAASLQQSLEMKALADKYKIMLLTNYETSWYPSTAETFKLIADSNYVGHIRKVVFHHGHQGPKEINVTPEFFNWLTDPIQNGGGALVDFGCYGSNLITYLTHGQKPLSVTAITRQYKPAIYPKVEDDATIIVNYPSLQCVIQASWNWTFARKDMEVYGDSAYIIAVNGQKLRLRKKESEPELERIVTAKDIPVYEDPFSYLAAVLRNKVQIEPYGLYSLENNLLVVRILEAAKESAKTGKTVLFK